MSAQEDINKLRTLVQQNGALMTKVAQESTLLAESQAIQSAIQNIDLSSVENKVGEVKQAVENIKLPEIDTTELAKESTLNAVSGKLDNINVEVDLSAVAKQGENADATNSAIYDAVKAIPELKNMYAAHFEPNDEGEDTYTMVLPLAAVVDGDTLII